LFVCQGTALDADKLTDDEWRIQRKARTGFTKLDAKYFLPFFTRKFTRQVRAYNSHAKTLEEGLLLFTILQGVGHNISVLNSQRDSSPPHPPSKKCMPSYWTFFDKKSCEEFDSRVKLWVGTRVPLPWTQKSFTSPSSY
jgi:hypothetical protein